MVEQKDEANTRGLAATPGLSRSEVWAWESARLQNGPFNEVSFAALVSKRDQPEVEIIARVSVGALGKAIEILLIDPTPIEELRGEAYNKTFFGKIMPHTLQKFAGGIGRRDHLIAHTNQIAAETEMGEMNKWFYRQFDLKDGAAYGSFCSMLHGRAGAHGHESYAAIAPLPLHQPSEASTPEAALFAQSVNSEPTLPISIRPLPIDDYTQRVSEALRFLPKDW
jgi:hypothetical protein